MTIPPGAQAGTEPADAPGAKYLFSSPHAFLALGFGTGLSPVWPGTAGSLAGLPIGFAFQQFGIAWQAIAILALAAAGIWICERAGRDLGLADHPAIVWDEVVGMAAVVALAPRGAGWIVVAFVTFRFFDIVKPWPIGAVDRKLDNGFGVMADDILAAVYAVIALWIAQRGLAAIM